MGKKTFSEEITFIALVAEIIIVTGFSGLVFYHYFQQAEGLSVLSCVGVLLADFVACADLHAFLTRRTPSLRWLSFAGWIYLTGLTALLAGTVWMAMRHDHAVQLSRKVNNSQQSFSREEKQKQLAFLNQQIKTASDQKTRQELRMQMRALRSDSTVPAEPGTAESVSPFEEDSSWRWLYERGIHTLPGPSAILCLALLLALSVANRDEEERLARQANSLPIATQWPTELPEQSEKK